RATHCRGPVPGSGLQAASMKGAPRPRILVVDDNAITRKLVRVTLASEGYSVLEAEDGASAMGMLAREKPDLILQDLVLPDIGGIELVERLRAEPGGAGIPILA